MSGIIYAAISGKQAVNAFNGPANPEVAELSAKLLNQIDLSIDTKKSYSSKGFTFNYVTERQTAFLCVANESFQRRICFSFLERISKEWKEKGKVSKSFLESEMNFFTTNKEADKIRHVQKQVDEVKDIMMENIEKILERQEKLEDVDRKTEDLVLQSQTFHRSSKKLKCELIKKNIKLTICIIAVVLIIIIAVVLIIVFNVKK